MPMTRRLMVVTGLGSLINVGAILALDRWRQGSSLSLGEGAESSLAVAEAEVIIRGFQYLPAEVTLKRGGKITFTNEDSTPHTATPLEGAQFEGTGRLRRGESKGVAFEQAGIQEYFCDIHPSMMGRVIVVE
ncbi:MAG: cupredoxin domain-containing protein [Thermostichus sp. HHBFW_bins_43]